MKSTPGNEANSFLGSFVTPAARKWHEEWYVTDFVLPTACFIGGCCGERATNSVMCITFLASRSANRWSAGEIEFCQPGLLGRGGGLRRLTPAAPDGADSGGAPNQARRGRAGRCRKRRTAARGSGLSATAAGVRGARQAGAPCAARAVWYQPALPRARQHPRPLAAGEGRDVTKIFYESDADLAAIEKIVADSLACSPLLALHVEPQKVAVNVSVNTGVAAAE